MTATPPPDPTPPDEPPTAATGGPPTARRNARGVPRRSAAGRRWRLAGAAVLALQLAWLLAQSVHLFDRFSLTSDFALFFQAWHQVAAGHLDPTATIYRTGPFLSNHFELLVYPLALLHFLDPGGLILLVLQDMAVAAAELVAFFWVIELVDEHWTGGLGHAVVAGSLVVLAVDPWVWWSSAFDFHLEVFATLFSVLAARSLWNRHWAAAVVWTALTLCCGTVESVVLLGIGAGLVLAQRRLWRAGVALIAVAVAWVLGLNATGYDKGSELATTYGYLTGSAPGAQIHVTQVVAGVLRHPRLAARVALTKGKAADLWHIVAGPGLLGVASVIGLPVAAALLIPAALNAQASVVQPEAAFQVLPLYVLLPVGSVLLVCWLARRGRPWRVLGLVLGLAAVVESIVLAALWIPRVTPYFDRTDAGAAAVLSQALARTPADAEVIASNGFIGRFAGRPWVYAIEEPDVADSGPVPVRAPVVEFVLSVTQGLETTVISDRRADITQVQHRLHATEILHSAGIDVFVWHPPRGVHSVDLPGLTPGR